MACGMHSAAQRRQMRFRRSTPGRGCSHSWLVSLQVRRSFWSAACTEMNTRYRRSPYLVFYWAEDTPVLLNANTVAGYSVDPKLIGFLSQMTEWHSPEELSGTEPPVEVIDLAELHKL